MQNDHSKHNKMRIRFPLVRDQLEISEETFLRQLFNLGFKLGRSNMPEHIEDILEHVPGKYRQDFWDGVRGWQLGRP